MKFLYIILAAIIPTVVLADWGWDPYYYNGYNYYGAGAFLYDNYYFGNMYTPSLMMVANSNGYLGFPGWFPNWYPNWDYSSYYNGGLWDMAYYGALSSSCGSLNMGSCYYGGWNQFSLPFDRHFRRHRRFRHHHNHHHHRHNIMLYGGLYSGSGWGSYYRNKQLLHHQTEYLTRSSAQLENVDQKTCDQTKGLVRVPISNLLTLSEKDYDNNEVDDKDFKLSIKDVSGKNYYLDETFSGMLPSLTSLLKEAAHNASSMSTNQDTQMHPKKSSSLFHSISAINMFVIIMSFFFSLIVSL